MDSVKVKNQFYVSNKVSSLREYIDNEIINNIPKDKSIIKNHLMDEIYMLKKNLFYASINQGNILDKYLKECLINIMMIDDILGYFDEYKYVKNKKIVNAVSILSEIKTIVYGWKKNNENKEKN